MLPLRLCSWLVFLAGSNWAAIPYDEVEFQIFSKKSTDFKSRIYDSLQTTENFFNNEAVEVVVDIGAVFFAYVPFVGNLGSLVPIFRGLLAEESDWTNQIRERAHA